MNKIINMIIIFLIITLVACTDSTKTVDDENKESNEEVQKQDINEEKENQTNKSNHENKEINKEGKVENDFKSENEHQYKINENWFIVPENDEADDEIVLLTIDDAPDKHGLKMAKTLKSLDAQAIFFVNGHFLESEEKQAELKEIHDMGFLIGNHTYTHPFLPDLTEEEQEKEIVELNDLVEDIIGERPLFFRAPNGANTDFSRELADKEGMTLMNWVYGYDWEEEYQSKEAITEIMLNTPLLSNGANLLMHDREWTAEALSDIVNGLRDKGYDIVDPHLIQTK